VMWKEVRRLAQEGLTLLLTTHYLEEADQLAQRLAIVDGGRIVAEGTPEELKGGLHGDVVSVDLADRGRMSEAELVLRGLTEVSGVMADGSRLYAHVGNGARTMPALLAALERAGLEVAQVSLSRPSLDDVYLTATGHAYREEGTAAAAGR
jgi:ABC-2 type transport system ATP-binding protein